MNQIYENVERVGNFTSSQISKLLTSGDGPFGFGAPALEYIREKRWERKLKRPLMVEVTTRSILWGKFLEERVHNLLPLGYRHVNNVTLDHLVIDCWKGSPDEINELEDTVSDIKCYQPKAFCQYVDVLTRAKEQNDVSIFKKENPDEYWQLVSNSVLTGLSNIEAIVYMPYESELLEIREEAENYDGDDPWRFRFIYEVDRTELAYLPDDSNYKNLNIFRFPVPEEDVKLITSRVKNAEILLTRQKDI